VDETAQKPQSVDISSDELKLAAQQMQRVSDGWFSSTGKLLAYCYHFYLFLTLINNAAVIIGNITGVADLPFPSVAYGLLTVKL